MELTPALVEAYREKYPLESLIRICVDAQTAGRAKYPEGAYLRLDLFAEIEGEARDIINYTYLLLLRLKMLEDLLSGVVSMPRRQADDERWIEVPAEFRVPVQLGPGPSPADQGSTADEFLTELTVRVPSACVEILNKARTSLKLSLIPTSETEEGDEV